ncbi:MAG: ZIP family metal transporter [Clostridia bacterium]|nr:ZIP family metal transporter [Clostridia bacterium]
MEWLNSLQGWQQALFATTITWALTAAGAALVFFFKKVNDKSFAFTLSFAAGIMLASTFFSLLLPAVESGGKFAFITVSLGFALGGALMIICDLLITKSSKNNNVNKSKNTSLCIAVTVHNIPEGLVVGVAFGAASLNGTISVFSALVVAIGIAIQNFPEGMCIAFPLRANGASRFKSFFFGQISGIVEIFAGVLGALAVNFISGILPWALSFSAGAMVAVVCSELIPESFKNGKILATVGVIIGFIVMMVLDVALG